MLIRSITLAGHTWSNVTVQFDRYVRGGAESIELWITEDLYPEPLAVATVNLPDSPPAEGCVWIKDWSENDGMLDALTQAGVIAATGRTMAAGYVLAHEARILRRA